MSKEKISLKKSILEACRKQQVEVMEHIKGVMDEARDSANEYGLPKDRYDSYRAQIMRKRDLFAKQLQKATDQMEVLDRVDPEKLNDKVEFGSVVMTSDQKLFISSGIGKVNAMGETYFALSPVVPFFLAVEGLKKGDEYEFRGKKGKIVDVF